MLTIEERKSAVLDRLDVAGLVAELFDRRTPAGADQVLVLCPVHQESTPSCSVNTRSGLWNCKACGASGNVFDLYMAARGLDFPAALAELESRCGIEPPGGSPRTKAAAPAPKKSTPKANPKQAAASSPRGPAVAVFRYYDDNNVFCYQKTRFEPGRDGQSKEFAFEHPTGEGFAPRRGPHPALLYGLHRLATAPPAGRVFVVEGEGKADALTAWGLIAVCSDSGAAGRWPENFNHFFAGRRVVLLPDNDQPGEKYAGKVAEALKETAAAVEVLRLPGLLEKGDVIDWIASRRAAGLSDAEIKAEFLHLAATHCEPWQAPAGMLPVVIPLGDDDEGGDDDTSPERSRSNRGAPRLLAMLAGQPLLCDSTGGTYVQIDGDVLPLDPKNPRLGEVLAARYYAATGQTIGREALTAVCQILSHQARQTGELAPMANRCTAVGDALVFDLGNRRAVRITPGAWQVTEPAPGTFRDWQHKRPHPEPARGGNLRRLLDFVRVAPEDAELFLFSLVASLAPGLSRPALNVEGPQGSGKSSAARKMKRLLDPGTPEISMIPRKTEDLDLILSRHSVAVLDNVSFVTPELADYFCGLITGAGLLRRVLHTTSELLEIDVDVLLIFTGISALSNRPDLTERMLKIRLERIADDERRTDRELDAEFAEALPEILGGLFDALAGGLALLPDYRPPRLPRLAEFCRLAAACAEAAEPGGGGRYLAAFFKNQGNQYQELAESDGFFAATLEALRTKNPLEGSFKEICDHLKEIANPGPKEKFPTAHSLRRTLERLAVAFESAGVGFVLSKPGERTATAKGHVSIFTRATAAELATESDTPPRPPEPPELAGLMFEPGELGP
ncbi:CHC2 zinc finger domain-containing protein [Desulfuromonas thiophila]|uniref:CHC2 zinc finger domain-containing protein n=1 Tax=Desulfuromonas thiophila TaxID=57664 RepID=UPI0024A84B7B|nr:CHC2 zinc finger domain-containing protein [Desulfuromonas thiophila]